MATSWAEKLSTHRERVGKELAQGQEFATHLQILLNKHYGDGFPSADELVVKILRSFTEALSLVTSGCFVENFQNLTSSQVDSVCCHDRRSEDSRESKKRETTKERRCCYKRKRTSQSWTTVSSTREDGYGWRKYGQKEILNAKYTRSYFRCTHKYDQGCTATKKVQRMEEDPQMYRTTYIGYHTCTDILKVPHIITTQDSSPWRWESYMLTSHSNTPTQLDHQHNPFTSRPSTIIKKEFKEENPSDLIDDLEHSIWKDLGAFGSADHYGQLDSTGYTESTCKSLDIDFAATSIEFEGDFSF